MNILYQLVLILRQLETNNPPILRRIFFRFRFCCEGRIAGYVTVATKSKADKKASKMGGLLVSSCLMLTIAGSTYAEPFIPVDDNQVLERLPGQVFQSKSHAKLKILRDQFKASPQDWTSASQLAQHYIHLAKNQADPRYMGYAQAVLKPWWTTSQPSMQALILRAVIRQNSHDFEGANEDLDQILNVQPGHIQANLTRATIATVQGNYQIAIQHCQQLMRRSSMILGLICQSTPASLNGKAITSYRLLKQILLTNTSIPQIEKQWAWTSLAEIAWRLGNYKAADEHFLTAIKMHSRDMYLQRVYADFLLQQHRAIDVINLISSNTSNDSLLLRLALAKQMIFSAQLNEDIAILEESFMANRKRGSTLHQGDEARFKLFLLNQPQAALKLAKQNWQIQRESVDTYILLESAIAVNDVRTIQNVEKWLVKQGTEDVLITQMLTDWRGGNHEI